MITRSSHLQLLLGLSTITLVHSKASLVAATSLQVPYIPAPNYILVSENIPRNLTV